MIIFLLAFLGFLFFLFYPRQKMPLGRRVNITIPNKKYHDDCLHPCVRFVSAGFADSNWWMIQSPFYSRDTRLENPILFNSTTGDPTDWQFVCEVENTPLKGYNSDPSLIFDGDYMWVIWREFNTESCDKHKVEIGVFAKCSKNGRSFSEKLLLKGENVIDGIQKLLSPVIIKEGDRFVMLSVISQKRNNSRKFIGLNKSVSYELKESCFLNDTTIKLQDILTVDKFKQLWYNDKLYFLPWVKKHQIWHIDICFYNDTYYLVSSDEWGDNIMLSLSSDLKRFHTCFKPLLNVHYLESKVKQRHYLYKSSLVKTDDFGLFYTLTDNGSNHLYYTQIANLP